MKFEAKFNKQRRSASFWVYQIPSGGFYSRDKKVTEIPEGWEGLKKITSTNLCNAKRYSQPMGTPPHEHEGLSVGRWVQVNLVNRFALDEDSQCLIATNKG